MSSCKAPTSAVGAADPTIAEALAEVSIDSVKVYIDDLVALHTRHTLSTQADPERGIGAAVDYLAARCRQWAETADQQRPRPIVEKVYYAAGGMGVLETVRILSGIPLQQTVKCLFVSGEEQGLDGSRHFASRASEESWPIVAVMNNDMIGNSRASGTELHEDHKVRVFSESVSGEDSDSRQLARYIQEMARIYVPEQQVVHNYRKDRYGRGGDHSNFLAAGFTAVRVCEYCEDYERTHQDVRTEGGVDYGDVQAYVDFPMHWTILD